MELIRIEGETDTDYFLRTLEHNEFLEKFNNDIKATSPYPIDKDGVRYYPYYSVEISDNIYESIKGE